MASLKTNKHQLFCFIFIRDCKSVIYVNLGAVFKKKENKASLYIRENVLNSLVFSDTANQPYTIFILFINIFINGCLKDLKRFYNV